MENPPFFFVSIKNKFSFSLTLLKLLLYFSKSASEVMEVNE